MSQTLDLARLPANALLKQGCFMDEVMFREIGFFGTWGDEVVPVRRESSKLSRNAPCPCGSGKKLKRCCGANVDVTAHASAERNQK